MPGSVRVRTWYSGVSAGTELTAYRGSNPYLTRTWDAGAGCSSRATPTFAYPVEGWGYSEVGEVVEVADGRDATRRRGRGARHLGPPQRGGAARRAAVADRVWTGQDPVSGTFARVGSIALNALLAADVRLGDRVAVFGQGVIGLLATRLAVLAGAEVVAVDVARAPARRRPRDGGRRTWCGPTCPGVPGPRCGPGRDGGVDSAIELSGSDRALHEAVRSVVVDGTVVASGFYQGGAAHLRLGEEFHHNRVRIVASQISGTPVALGPRWDQPRLVRTFMDQVRRGRVDVRSLVTDVVDAADVADALRAPRPRRPGDPPGRAAVPRGPGGLREPTRLDTGPRFPDDRRAASRSWAAGTIAQSAHLPGLRAARRRRDRRVEPDPGHDRDDPGPVPVRRTGLRQRRGAAGRPRGAATSTWRPGPRGGWTGSRPRSTPASTSSPRSR